MLVGEPLWTLQKDGHTSSAVVPTYRFNAARKRARW